MPTCSVCALPTVSAVNRALVTKTETRATIAKRFGVSRQALLRHESHLPAELTDAANVLADGRAGALLDELQGLKGSLHALLVQAQTKGDLRGATTIVREIGRILELVARITGDLTPPPPVQINMVQTAEFQTVTARVIAALEGHDTARARVIEALRVMN